MEDWLGKVPGTMLPRQHSSCRSQATLAISVMGQPGYGGLFAGRRKKDNVLLFTAVLVSAQTVTVTANSRVSLDVRLRNEYC